MIFASISVLKTKENLVNGAFGEKDEVSSSFTLREDQLLYLEFVDDLIHCELLVQICLKVVDLEHMSGCSFSNTRCILINADRLSLVAQLKLRVEA